MEEYKIGDILFFEIIPDKWYYKIISKLQSYFDGTPYHHVALYIGRSCISEMHDTGLRRARLIDNPNVKIKSVRVADIDQDRFMKRVNDYEENGEKEYPKGDLFQVGLRVIIKKLFKIDLPMLYDFKGRICTDYIRHIYLMYGTRIGESNMSVGELWRELKK